MPRVEYLSACGPPGHSDCASTSPPPEHPLLVPAAAHGAVVTWLELSECFCAHVALCPPSVALRFR